MTEIPDNKLESIPAELLNEVRDDAEYAKVQIEGSHLARQRIWELIREFKETFKGSVVKEPAKLTPFRLEVDVTQWRTRANQLNVRQMDRERSQTLEEFITILLANDVIEPCNDGFYSQAFLVPKPNGKWRLVLDFKNLNKATTNQYRLPLPDIKEMLHRVGESRPFTILRGV